MGQAAITLTSIVVCALALLWCVKVRNPWR